MNRSILMAALLAGAGPFAAAPAQAQGAPAESSAAAASAEAGLEEIVVTAQRRSESAQDVPISIVAFSSEMIENIGALRNEAIFNATPGVSFTTNGSLGSPIVMVRGIGSVMTLQGVEPAVALYVDDIVIGSTQAFNTSLLDVDRVEVLRGPQGTLYGKNTMGGAIRFFSRLPADEDSLELVGAYGSYDLYDLRAIGNAVLSPQVMLRASVTAQGHEGFADNDAGPDAQTQDTLGARLQSKLLLSERATLNLSVDWSRDNQLSYTRAPFATATQRDISEDDPARERRRLWGTSANLDYDFDGATLTSITAYRKLRYRTRGDSDHSAAALATDFSANRFSQFSQELRLVSDDKNALSWVLGGYYYHDKTNTTSDVTLLGFGPAFGLPFGYREGSTARLTSDTLAAFADATYQLSEILEFTAGLRYTYDRKKVDYTHQSADPFICGIFAPCRTVEDRSTDNMLTPRAVLTANWSDDFMTYASVSRGMKGGGFNIIFVPAVLNDLAFAKEKAWNYEVGFKSQLLDNRVRLNASAYRFDWENQQVEVTLPSGVEKLRTNAPRSRSTGAEVELTVHPTDPLELSLSYAYTDAEFRRFSPTSLAVALSGNRQPYVSRHNLIAAATYNQPLSDDLSLVVYGSYNYKSGRFLDPENVLFQPKTGIVDARVGIEGDGWGVSLFANNLFDKTYRVSAAYDFFGSPQASLNDPRTYGLRVNVEF